MDFLKIWKTVYMKTRFFIILSLLICFAWNLSLEGMSDDRKNEIINALDAGFFILKDNEINADLGEIKCKNIDGLEITISNATPLVYAANADIDKNHRTSILKNFLFKNAELFEIYSILKNSEDNYQTEHLIDVLINSLKELHKEIVDWFIRNHQPIGLYRGKGGNTLFHLLASDDNYLQSFKKLYEKNLNVKNLEALNENGQTPLHMALEKKAIPGEINAGKIAKYIIEETGIDLTKKYKFQEGADTNEDIIFNRVWQLSEPSKPSKPSKLRYLRGAAYLNIFKSTIYDKPLNKNGDRFIHYLAGDVYEKIMDALLKKNIAFTAKNRNGKTALHVAFDYQKTSVKNKPVTIKLIQSNKFDFTKIYKTREDHRLNENTLFEYIIAAGTKINKNTFRELFVFAIQSIIDTKKMNLPLTSDGSTLFHFLARNSNLFKIFFSKVEADFKKNIDIKDNNNKTPLFYTRDIAILEKIIKLGADTSATDNKGKTILHYAVYKKTSNNKPNSEYFEYLLKNIPIKDLINKKNNSTKTAFDEVIQRIIGTPKACEVYENHIDLLLEHGAEIGDAITTLTDAQKKIKEKIVRMLNISLSLAALNRHQRPIL